MSTYEREMRRVSAGAGWRRGWRARFGWGEIGGTAGAVAGFAAGYQASGSLLAAAGLATMCEAAMLYGWVGPATMLAARRATAHLAGWRRLAAAAYHAVAGQLVSCAAAEVLDDLLIRPGLMARGAWLARPLPGGIWLGFLAGKAAADVAWYGLEAAARCGLTRTLAIPAAMIMGNRGRPGAPVRHDHGQQAAAPHSPGARLSASTV